MGLTLVGIALLLAHTLWRVWVYFRFRSILAEEEAGVFAERVLRLHMSGFRVERGWGSVLLGYALVASTYPFEADANREALNVVPPQHREEVRKVLQALSSSYLMVPLGGALVVLGWLGHAS